jgi:hypothetical protein
MRPNIVTPTLGLWASDAHILLSGQVPSPWFKLLVLLPCFLSSHIFYALEAILLDEQVQNM